MTCVSDTDSSFPLGPELLQVDRDLSRGLSGLHIEVDVIGRLESICARLEAEQKHGSLNSQTAEIAWLVARRIEVQSDAAARLSVEADKELAALTSSFQSLLHGYDDQPLADHNARPVRSQATVLYLQSDKYEKTLETPLDPIRLFFLQNLSHPFPTPAQKISLAQSSSCKKKKVESDLTNWRRRSGWSSIKEKWAKGDLNTMKRLIEGVESGKEKRKGVIEDVEKCKAYLERREDERAGDWVIELTTAAKQGLPIPFTPFTPIEPPSKKRKSATRSYRNYRRREETDEEGEEDDVEYDIDPDSQYADGYSLDAEGSEEYVGPNGDDEEDVHGNSGAEVEEDEEDEGSDDDEYRPVPVRTSGRTSIRIKVPVSSSRSRSRATTPPSAAASIPTTVQVSSQTLEPVTPIAPAKSTSYRSDNGNAGFLEQSSMNPSPIASIHATPLRSIIQSSISPSTSIAAHRATDAIIETPSLNPSPSQATGQNGDNHSPSQTEPTPSPPPVSYQQQHQDVTPQPQKFNYAQPDWASHQFNFNFQPAYPIPEYSVHDPYAYSYTQPVAGESVPGQTGQDEDAPTPPPPSTAPIAYRYPQQAHSYTYAQAPPPPEQVHTDHTASQLQPPAQAYPSVLARDHSLSTQTSYSSLSAASASAQLRITSTSTQATSIDSPSLRSISGSSIQSNISGMCLNEAVSAGRKRPAKGESFVRNPRVKYDHEGNVKQFEVEAGSAVEYGPSPAVVVGPGSESGQAERTPVGATSDTGDQPRWGAVDAWGQSPSFHIGSTAPVYHQHPSGHYPVSLGYPCRPGHPSYPVHHPIAVPAAAKHQQHQQQQPQYWYDPSMAPGQVHPAVYEQNTPRASRKAQGGSKQEDRHSLGQNQIQAQDHTHRPSLIVDTAFSTPSTSPGQDLIHIEYPALYTTRPLQRKVSDARSDSMPAYQPSMNPHLPSGSGSGYHPTPTSYTERAGTSSSTSSSQASRSRSAGTKHARVQSRSKSIFNTDHSIELLPHMKHLQQPECNYTYGGHPGSGAGTAPGYGREGANGFRLPSDHAFRPDFAWSQRRRMETARE